jgi:nicotinate-nucleotide pyrophosphorylase (carboxylating)
LQKKSAGQKAKAFKKAPASKKTSAGGKAIAKPSASSKPKSSIGTGATAKTGAGAKANARASSKAKTPARKAEVSAPKTHRAKPQKGSKYDRANVSREEVFKTSLAEKMLALAILEDLGPERLDVTSLATVASSKMCRARLELKESAVICGLDIFKTVIKSLASPSNKIKLVELFDEGTYVEVKAKPVIVATMEADSQTLLTAERLSLNLIQRMCGVATIARRYTKIAAPHSIQILDTRKTMPGLRAFDRRAVLAGGGTNHRFGLFDAILIKDNHVQSAGGVAKAVKAAQKYLQTPRGLALANKQIEVEVTNFQELDEALAARADRVMLDNMPPEMVRKAVARVAKSGHKCFIEVSGGVNESNLKSYLIAGVNAISIGAITHSAKNIDLSLEFS